MAVSGCSFSCRTRSVEWISVDRQSRDSPPLKIGRSPSLIESKLARGDEWGNWIAGWGFKLRRRPYGAVAWTGEVKSFRKGQLDAARNCTLFLPRGADAYLYHSSSPFGHVRFHRHPQFSLLSPSKFLGPSCPLPYKASYCRASDLHLSLTLRITL
jgi:hypothetical protein